MKNIKLVLSVLMLLTVSLSCKLLNRPASRDASKAPPIDFVTPGKPLNVTVQLDKKQTTSSMVPRTGGSVSLTSADGSKFTLDVPAYALEADTTITMTAVKSIDGAPLDSNTPTAVQLEPSGLFFKEMPTLTIVPAKDISIKQQIIFGYEGDGKDYHLAPIDPKSKEIKVKLMRFSGAGVGSGSDSAWAANLLIQANDARTRLQQKLGEFLQTERRKQILGIPEPSDMWAKIDKLAKIAAECRKAYRVSGESNGVSFSGQICGLDKPFVIDATFPGGGSAKTTFTPSSVTGGATSVSGGGAECVQSGGGNYTVTINQDGSGSITWTSTSTLTCPGVSNTRTATLPSLSNSRPRSPVPEGQFGRKLLFGPATLSSEGVIG